MTINLKKIISPFVFFCVTAMTANAQIITWAVKPGIYNSIKRLWPGLFLAINNEGTGVINSKGDVIVEPIATRITGFYEDKALVLKNEGKSERILGILSTNGSYVKVEKKYYAITDQELFSEDYLTVKNSSGQVAFMNTNGVIEREFSDTSLSPFSEGYATVGDGDKFRIIDKRFNFVQISGNLGYVGARISGGTNVYKNVTILVDGYNEKLIEFNVKTRQGKEIKGSKKKMIDGDFDEYSKWDYLGCLTCISGRPSAIPYTKVPEEEVTYKVVLRNGSYGYSDGNDFVFPPQFEAAEDFRGQNAIAMTNGNTGLLFWRKSEGSFKAVSSPQEISYMKDRPSNIEHKFSLEIPEELSSQNTKITVTNPDGIEREVSENGTLYSFKDQGRTGACSFPITVSSDGLKMWEGMLIYSYTPKEPVPIDENKSRGLIVKLSMNNLIANSNNQCMVTATVSNPSSHDITTTVKITGSDLLQTITKQVTIPAHESIAVSTYFMVRKRAALGQWVRATTTDGSSHTLSGLELRPR